MSMPGSYRQHHMFRRLLLEALDCVAQGIDGLTEAVHFSDSRFARPEQAPALR